MPILWASGHHVTVKPKFHLARHVSTRLTRQARRYQRAEPCCSTSSTQRNCMAQLVERVVTSLVEFGLLIVNRRQIVVGSLSRSGC